MSRWFEAAARKPKWAVSEWATNQPEQQSGRLRAVEFFLVHSTGREHSGPNPAWRAVRRDVGVGDEAGKSCISAAVARTSKEPLANVRVGQRLAITALPETARSAS